MRVTPAAGRLAVVGDAEFPVNKGALCIKGHTAGELLDHPERLRSPLVRNSDGRLVEASWDEALERVATGILAIQERHGRHAVGVFGSGSLPNEKAYGLGKLARAVLRTSAIDYNGRYCMSSAAAASLRAFGLDRGVPFPIEDIASADVVLLVGANVAETMPPIMQYFEEQRARGGALIVVDPRRTPTARAATLHLASVPGTDLALANGLLHVIVRDGLVDEEYVARRTEGFDDVRAAVAGYWPERVERITGVAEADLERAAHLLASAKRAIILTGRGPEQHARGVANTLSVIDVALALGLVGRPGSGYGCLTGQGNGQGGRRARTEGRPAPRIPAHRRSCGPRPRRGRMGDGPRRPSGTGTLGVRDALDARRRRGRACPAGLRLERGRVVARCRTYRAPSPCARSARRERLLPLRDGCARARGLPQRPVGRRRGDDDEPGVARPSATSRGRSTGRGAHRSRADEGARRTPRRRAFLPLDRAGGRLREAPPRERRRPGRLRRHHLRANRSRRRRPCTRPSTADTSCRTTAPSCSSPSPKVPPPRTQSRSRVAAGRSWSAARPAQGSARATSCARSTRTTRCSP